jgi:hypothetical protein
MKLITITEAAAKAGRSRTAIHRWINEGWLSVVYTPKQPNQPVLIDEEHFDDVLPKILDRMENRRGGRGLRETDGKGRRRGRLYVKGETDDGQETD